MRNILFYILLWWPCLLLAQSGNVPSLYRYWFDHDFTSQTAAYTTNIVDVDASALDEGFHTLCFQVVNTLGEASPVRTTGFYRISPLGEDFDVSTVATVRYWFDMDFVQYTAACSGGIANIDASALTEGFHTLHFQVVNTLGEASPVRTTAFYRISPLGEDFDVSTVATVRYWFDMDYVQRTAACNGGIANIDASALTEGFHTLHFQVVNTLGEASPVRTTGFYRISPLGEDFDVNTVATVRYWFDMDFVQYTAACSGGIANIDASALDEGLHKLHFQVVNPIGEASPVRSVPFFRVVVENISDYAVKTIRYWTDGDPSTMRSFIYESGMYELNLSCLSEGLHTITYEIITADGQITPARTETIDRWFYDIYISKSEEYTDSLMMADPLFVTRPDLKMHFLASDVNVRGHLTVDEGSTLSLGKFVQTANWGYYNNGSKYTKAGADYYHPTTLLNEGVMRADSVIVKQSFYRDRWHFLSLPFNANVSDLDMPDDTYYALRAYDGEARAQGEMTDTWKNLRQSDQMEAGRGYIVQLTRESSDKTAELTFKALNDPQKNNIFTTDDVTTPLEEHQAEFAHNRSWNLVGNPFPSFYDSRCIDLTGNIIVWNGNGYSAYSLTDDSYVLMPFEAFFIQRPVDAATVTFSKDGRQHTPEVLERPAAARGEFGSYDSARRILNFTVTDGVDADQSRVVINEQASMDYEQEKDAPKFMETKPQTVQLFSVEGGVQYAINERPLADSRIIFSVYAPTSGEYRLGIVTNASERWDSDMTVYDTETGTTWGLADGDYVFTATEGMHNARLIVSLTGETTAIAQVNAYDDGEIKVADGQLAFSFMRDKHIKVFSLDGKTLFDCMTTKASVSLRSGIYVLDIDGKREKITVK